MLDSHVCQGSGSHAERGEARVSDDFIIAISAMRASYRKYCHVIPAPLAIIAGTARDLNRERKIYIYVDIYIL